MSLYQFFAKALRWSDLPDPSGQLSEPLSPTMIKEANGAVLTVTGESKNK